MQRGTGAPAANARLTSVGTALGAGQEGYTSYANKRAAMLLPLALSPPVPPPPSPAPCEARALAVKPPLLRFLR
jgi:hypothetical protein